jgi:hypothetical protein
VRIAVVIATVFAFFAAPDFAAEVGFEELRIASGAEPPLVAGIWYPTDAAGTQDPGSF